MNHGRVVSTWDNKPGLLERLGKLQIEHKLQLFHVHEKAGHWEWVCLNFFDTCLTFEKIIDSR